MTDDGRSGRDFGVFGLDQIFADGIPRETLLLLQGVPGSGKTTLALQFLLHALAKGEVSLLVSNAETPAQQEAGFDRYLIKPVKATALREVLAGADGDAPPP